jgi:acetylornithine/succinyldiaminopimelate/putrescine aminotransferase
MSLSELQELERTSVMGSYARFPVEFVRGEGARLWDVDGNEYLDFLCGISVTNLGHCHPRVVATIREQVGRLMHTSNLFYTAPAMRLAECLSRSSLHGKVFFCNSGAEANEAAIKLVRKAKHAGDVVVVHGAFHGRTYGALSATPQESKQAPFAPLVPGFRAVDPTPAAIAAAVDGHGAALIFDEIQCGMGRTGTLWAYEQTGVVPDAITVAKALGGGLPIGALITGPRLADVFAPGDHGSTFAGGPVVAVAALAALEVTEDPALLAGVRELGMRLAAGLEALPHVTSVRGRGLMLACEVDMPASAVVRRALLSERLIVNATGPTTVRLLPPLTIGASEVDEALQRLGAALAGQDEG